LSGGNDVQASAAALKRIGRNPRAYAAATTRVLGYDAHKKEPRFDRVSLEQDGIGASVKGDPLRSHTIIGDQPPLEGEAYELREGEGADIHCGERRSEAGERDGSRYGVPVTER
jgi:hypothetical protein